MQTFVWNHKDSAHIHVGTEILQCLLMLFLPSRICPRLGYAMDVGISLGTLKFLPSSASILGQNSPPDFT